MHESALILIHLLLHIGRKLRKVVFIIKMQTFPFEYIETLKQKEENSFLIVSYQLLAPPL